jgi:hypothetical protein
MREIPRPVRQAGLLLLGLCGSGGVLAIAGTWEKSFLAGNLAEIQDKSTYPAEAMRAVGRMGDSADLAQGLGVAVTIGALVMTGLVVAGYRWSRWAAVVFCVVVALGHVLLMLQDGSIGVKPYTDLSHDAQQEDLMNSLMVAPGYFLMLYPGEAAGVVLPFLIGWHVMRDSATDYFQRRRKATPERVFDVTEILAKRRQAADPQGVE